MLFGTYAVALLHMIRLLWDTRNFFILRKKKSFTQISTWPLWSADEIGVIWLHMTNHCNIHQLELQTKTPLILRLLRGNVTAVKKGKIQKC